MFRNRCLLLAASLIAAAPASAEILVRWDLDEVPSRDNLGVPALVVPAANRQAIERALALGFRVYAEVDAAGASAFAGPAAGVTGIIVNGQVTPEQIAALRKQLGQTAPRVISATRQGIWPHIRSNVVTTRNDVLQVASRTAQPWLEHNGAVIRAAASAAGGERPLLSIVWKPSTPAEAEQGPALDDYLVAIAEAGSFGADLVLPLHERLQKGLLLGTPSARGWWREIERYADFYAWVQPARYRRLASVGIVTAQPARGLELEMAKLLVRHNLAYELIAPDRVASTKLDALRLLIVPESPTAEHLPPLVEFARQGGTVMIAPGSGAAPPWRSGTPASQSEERASYRVGEGRVVELLKRVADPNRFALEVRDLLGRSGRIVEIWNGITVLAAPYEAPDGDTLLLTVVNYAHDPEAVQIRVPGTYAVVEYESPEEEAHLLSYTHRDGYTEFLLPALRVGGRVFLGKHSGL